MYWEDRRHKELYRKCWAGKFCFDDYTYSVSRRLSRMTHKRTRR